MISPQACRLSSVGLAIAGLAACPSVEADELPRCADDTLGIDPLDVGTHCAGASIARSLLPAPGGLTLRATLPAGLGLVVVDGVWQLTGTVPATDDIIDASFDMVAEQSFPDCVARETVRVGFFIDPCDGGDGTCGPFARPVPIDGFCLPDVIAADTPFAVTTLAGACLSSSCSDVRPAVCDVVVEGDRITVGGDVCVRSVDVGSCSEDCGGGDGAPCTVPGLPAGTWVVVGSAGELTITVPRAASADTACVFP
jgi:hypothetical protein